MKNRSNVITDTERKCVKCKIWKSFSDFHKHSQCLHGINTVCKECRKPLSKKSWNEKSLEYKIWNRAKSRATKRNLEFNIDIEDIKIPDICPVFNIPFESKGNFTPSIDRIDSSKGYIKGNIQIISTRANILKSNATIEELKLIITFLNNNLICI